MQAYAVLYPYAVICLAIAASVSTIIGGLYGFITLVTVYREWSPEKPKAADLLPYVLGGTALFVASCLAAMIELKIGAWVASIGCS